MMKKGLLTISAIALSMFLIAGCSGNDKETDEDKASQEEQETPADEQEQKDAPKGGEVDKNIGAEEELQEEIASEPGIESVMVQVVEGGDDNRVNADIVINEEQELSADEVADTYSKVIKEKYPDYFVDIIVVQDGEMLTQKTYE